MRKLDHHENYRYTVFVLSLIRLFYSELIEVYI